MSKKRRKQRPRRATPPAPGRFQAGMRARVKPGTTDPDFPDIPLGGWAGTVQEVDRRSAPPTYLLAWDRHTLEHMHPVYRKRCERDGLGVESMWLADEDLEPDTGGPAVLEEPRNLVTRPLRPDDQEDRIRAVFGLTSDDPLPPVDEGTLRTYHRHLASSLSFPFAAKCAFNTGPFQGRQYPLTVVGLLGPDEGDEEEGLLCRAVSRGATVELLLGDLEVAPAGPDCQLVEDYAYWWANSPAAEGPPAPVGPRPVESGPPAAGGAPVPRRGETRAFFTTLVRCGLAGAIYGAVLGTMLGAVEGALTGAAGGAALLALAGVAAGARYGVVLGAVNRTRLGPLFGGLAGCLAGGFAGALAGAAVVTLLGAFPGALAGGLAGFALGRLGAPAGYRDRGLPGALGGAAVGALAPAAYRDHVQALTGAAYGVGCGAAAGALLYLAVVGSLLVLDRLRYTR